MEREALGWLIGSAVVLVTGLLLKGDGHADLGGAVTSLGGLAVLYSLATIAWELVRKDDDGDAH